MASMASAAQPTEKERAPAAILRDLAAGAALIALGALTGGSSWTPPLDGVDIFFDALGAAWIVWALVRLVRR